MLSFIKRQRKFILTLDLLAVGIGAHAMVTGSESSVVFTALYLAFVVGFSIAEGRYEK